jgi:hypothetical protein
MAVPTHIEVCGSYEQYPTKTSDLRYGIFRVEALSILRSLHMGRAGMPRSMMCEEQKCFGTLKQRKWLDTGYIMGQYVRPHEHNCNIA